MMEKVKITTSCLIFLGFTGPTIVSLSAVTIDVRQNPTYLRKYGEKLVDFATCKDFDFFDYEQGPDDYGDCHVTQLEDADTIESIFPGRSWSTPLCLDHQPKTLMSPRPFRLSLQEQHPAAHTTASWEAPTVRARIRWDLSLYFLLS